MILLPLVEGVVAADSLLRGFSLGMSALGVGFTLYALGHARRSYNWALSKGQVERHVAQGHVLSQTVILLMQLTFAAIEIMVLSLPELPFVAMYEHQPDGWWIVTVIVMRKLLRFWMVALLLVGSVMKVRELRRVQALLLAGQ